MIMEAPFLELGVERLLLVRCTVYMHGAAGSWTDVFRLTLNEHAYICTFGSNVALS
jgi:hypothetical protein